MRKIEILDCTLRDGGMCLEDFALNEIHDLGFTKDDIDTFIQRQIKSNLDIIEIGSIELSEENKEKFSIYTNIRQASSIIKKVQRNQQKFAILYRGPDTPVSEIPDWNEGLCRFVRVIIRYSELIKSLDFCNELSRKGYKVFIQPMVTSRYKNEELDLLIEYANKMEAYALYIVDSYGHMDRREINRIFKYYNNTLSKKISIGFHGHNNINLAYSNACYFIEISSQRNIVVDCTVTGMGQGAGNLQTELIGYYMVKNFNKEYNMTEVLECAEIIEKYNQSNLWGYSTLNLLPAIYKTAYKYSSFFRNNYKMSYAEIDKILQVMPDEYRNRFTNNNASELLKNYKKSF